MELDRPEGKVQPWSNRRAEIGISKREDRLMAHFAGLLKARASTRGRAGTGVFPLLAAAFIIACCFARTAAAEQPPAVDGAAVVTVTGNIATTNRGPFDPASDVFFAYHNHSFSRAMQFSREALLRLPQHQVRSKVLKLEEAEYSGPLVRDVLREAGPTGGTVRVFAIDGYAAEFQIADLEKKDWILALSRNGKPLGLGDIGPVCLMRGPVAGDTPEQEHWVWAAFHIEVR
jgi:hypothetical protein